MRAARRLSSRRSAVRYSTPLNWWSAFAFAGSSAWPPGPSLALGVSELGDSLPVVSGVALLVLAS
jgi:hypothetical protein